MQRGAAEVSLLQHSGDPQSPLLTGSLWGSGSAARIKSCDNLLEITFVNVTEILEKVCF